MIDVVITRQNDGKVLGFDVSGHANPEYVEGTDMVCAAVSALVNSVNVSLTKHLHCNLLEDEDDGWASMVLQNQEPNDLTEAVFSVAVLGFKEIERHYPECIHVIDCGGETQC